MNGKLITLFKKSSISNCLILSAVMKGIGFDISAARESFKVSDGQLDTGDLNLPQRGTQRILRLAWKNHSYYCKTQ